MPRGVVLWSRLKDDVVRLPDRPEHHCAILLVDLELVAAIDNCAHCLCFRSLGCPVLAPPLDARSSPSANSASIPTSVDMGSRQQVLSPEGAVGEVWCTWSMDARPVIALEKVSSKFVKSD
jgi:hypothetical protein